MDYEQKVKQFLQPYMDLLRTVVLEAWEIYHNKYAENAYLIFNFGNSVIMNNLVIKGIEKYFEPLNNCEIRKSGNGATLIIRSSTENFRVDIRFKKVGKDYKTKNARTARNDKFVNQEPYLGEIFLPEHVVQVNINTGYKINEEWNTIEIWIICPNGYTSIAWKFKISDEVTAPKVIPITELDKQQSEKRTIADPSKFTEEQNNEES
jgi:hypothetical protein